MDKREIRFRTAADEIIRSNRLLRDHIRAVKDFYSGNVSVPIPPIDGRLETVLNPKSNGACKCLNDFCDALKEYRPGEYPTRVLNLLQKTTLSLIHDELEPIQRTPHCNMFITIVNDLHIYLRTENPAFTLEAHLKKLNKFRDQWNDCCYKNSDAFYDQTSKLLDARKAAKKKPKSPNKKKHLGKGRQTAFMEHQRKTFTKYLIDHPVTASVSARTRAHQCWQIHQKEWDIAAKDGSGYFDYKTLARAK